MPRLDVDLQEARDFSAIPERDYMCEVAEVSDVQEGDKAKYVRVTFQVQEPEEFAGRNLFRNYVIEGEGAGFFRDMWETVTGEELPIGEMVEIDTDDLIGEEVVVVNEHREWEGETRNSVANLIEV